MSENWSLMIVGVFTTKREKVALERWKCHNEELHDVCLLPNIILGISSAVARMEQVKNQYNLSKSLMGRHP
jgi:hypothetical protein